MDEGCGSDSSVGINVPVQRGQLWRKVVGSLVDDDDARGARLRTFSGSSVRRSGELNMAVASTAGADGIRTFHGLSRSCFHGQVFGPALGCLRSVVYRRISATQVIVSGCIAQHRCVSW